MSLTLALAIIAASAAVGIGAILLLRRHSPEGSRFRDSDRAAGVFGVVGTVFAILLGFIILFAFDSHSTARDAASTEASTVQDAFQTAQLFGKDGRTLKGDLVCYARGVIHDGWHQMQDANPSVIVEGWNDRMDRSLNALTVRNAKQDSGFQELLAARGHRDEARRVRLEEAGHTIPAIIWIAVALACLGPLCIMLFFADPAETKFSQALSMGFVTALTVSCATPAAAHAAWTAAVTSPAGDRSRPAATRSR